MHVSESDIIKLRRRADGTLVRTYPDGREEPYQAPQPDWARIDALTDEDIARQIAEDPDVAPDMGDVPPEEFRRPGSPTYVDVRKVRERLEMTQERFAATFGISVGTLRGWELGRRRPEGPARVLLTVIEREPEAVRRALAV